MGPWLGRAQCPDGDLAYAQFADFFTSFFVNATAAQFAAMVDHAVSPINSLRAATINAANLPGIADRGDMAAGKLAGIAGVAVVFVRKGGK